MSASLPPLRQARQPDSAAAAVPGDHRRREGQGDGAGDCGVGAAAQAQGAAAWPCLTVKPWALIWQSGDTAAEAYCDLRGLAVAWSGSGFGALTVSRKCSDSRRARHVGKPISYPSLGSYERAALRPKFLPDMTDIDP